MRLFGAVAVSRLSVREAEAALASKLDSFFHQPQVTLSVVEYASQPVSVMG